MPWKSHDIAESDRDRPLSIIPTSRLSAAARGGYSRPKPPPPSSRHGKLIKVELGADDRGENPQARPIRNSQVSPEPHPADSDVNKPLPLPPARTVEDDATESPFDREAAGKAPETCAEPHISQSLSTTTTRARSESQGSTQSRRSVVPPQAPPPRRHARSESKVAGSQPKSNEEDPPRSSLDSTRSRSESIRAGLTSGSSASAPAPPPPRRPNHGRSNSSYSIVNQLGAVVPPTVSPSSQRLGSPPTSGRPSLDGSTTAIPVESSRESTPRIAAPPPPPARNSSVRRPPSSQKSSDVGSISGATRKSTRDSLIAPPPPPPPPPRQRGSSRGSMEGHNRPTPKDLAAQTRGDTSLSKGAAVVATSPSSTTDIPGAGILADLDALQREVDALMKQAKTG
ncbi:hypothetical protein Micbo1qcDRAFT_164879 [Microdochium bolleyi]|uniref:Uncharacterized protein n=1 Tax=Microdochium bolleyi TaxID=196109 RepID=A0A136IZY9_9PEZI|nr:hypothetical protein Micbo1qcDRAFT_164879 [Microdochium bolleyi]